MARKKQIPLTPEQRTAENRATALKQFSVFDRTPESVIPSPTRTFAIGEPVIYGNRVNCIIVDHLALGKGYLIEMDEGIERDKKPTGAKDYIAAWWYQIEKADARNNNIPQLFEPYVLAHHSKCDLESVFFNMHRGGLVCDPLFQREYVWNDENRTALLDSVFERLEIGSFLFVRHHGYIHEKTGGTVDYRNLDGNTVTINRAADYTMSIIDGQQRLTTLFHFYTDRFTYRGLKFSQLNRHDQGEFERFSVTFRIFEEEQVDKKTLLKLFLQSNRGVPQAPEHIAKVQALYDAEK